MNSNLQPLITTGLSGLVGSKLQTSFNDTYAFTNLDISNTENPVDITDYNQVATALEKNPAEFVVHFAAFTDVTAAFNQTDDTTGLAYLVNVKGTENIARACTQLNKHLIHISTAFVFDGQKEGLYTEQDSTSPIEWYGKTKALAEDVVTALTSPWTILRIDFPFRSDPFPRPDIVRKTIDTIQKGYPLFNDHFFGPTFIDDFAKVIDWVIRSGTTGLFHASNGESWSDYDLGQRINDIHQLGLDVKSGSLTEYLKTLQRPYQRNTAMSNTKLAAKLDFSLSTIEDALRKVVISG